MTRKEIFSKNLNAILESLQKSQIEVAKAINVSQQTFNTWCRGIAIPRMDKIQALADYFHVPMASLIEDINEMSSSLSSSADEIAKAVNMYNAYITADPKIRGVIESLLDLNPQVPEIPQLKELKSLQPKIDIPYLKKDTDK